MWLRLAAHTDIGALRIPTAPMRVRTTNMRHAYRMVDDYRQCALAFRLFFERQAWQFAGAEALEQTARRSLALEALVASYRCFDKKGDTNMAQLTALAREIDPTITRTAWWWKTVVKRTVGWAWCNSFGQARAAFRRITAVAARAEESSWFGDNALQSASSSTQGAMDMVQKDVP